MKTIRQLWMIAATSPDGCPTDVVLTAGRTTASSLAKEASLILQDFYSPCSQMREDRVR